ncbi:MAG TPA: CotH kinase family protein [Gammaproteobacteria bacterium]
MCLNLRLRSTVPVIALLLASCSLFAAEHVPIGEIYLQMDSTDAQVLVRKDRYDKSSFAVTLIDGETRHKGRIKILGSSSRMMDKRSFSIKLGKGDKWQGSSRISLNAMATDPTLLRNWMTWQMFHSLGMAAPNVSYERVYINGQPQGIYLRIEWIETAMFERYGLGRDGQLFHPNDSTFCGDLDKSRGGALTDCWLKFTPPAEDFSALATLVEGIDATPIDQFDRFMEQNFDVDSVLNWLAVNVLTSDGDTYNKNYFLYRSRATNKWSVVPWDYDLTYGRNFDPFLDYPNNVYNDNFQYFYPPELGAYSPLKEKLLRNPRLKARFLARLSHLLGIQQEANRGGFGFFESVAIRERIAAMHDELLEEVRRDPRLRNRQASFQESIDALDHYIVARTAYLEKILLNSTAWDPERAYWRPELAPPPPPYPATLHASAIGRGEVVVVADSYGYLLAQFRPDDRARAVELLAEVEFAHAPRAVPPGVAAESCIQRSWIVTANSPEGTLQGSLTLEYFQENSQRQELGRVKDEAALSLWRQEGAVWQRLPTRVNALANILTTDGLTISPGQTQRFVACLPDSRLGVGK